MSLAGRTVLQMDQAAPAHQSLLRRVGERGQNANLDGHRGVRAGGHRPQTAGARLGTPFGPANSQRLPVRESSLDSSAYPKQRAIAIISIPQPTENVQHLTGHSWLWTSRQRSLERRKRRNGQRPERVYYIQWHSASLFPHPNPSINPSSYQSAYGASLRSKYIRYGKSSANS